MRAPLLPLLAPLALATLWFAGCGSDRTNVDTCGAREVLVDGVCVPRSPRPQPDDATGDADTGMTDDVSQGDADDTTDATPQDDTQGFTCEAGRQLGCASEGAQRICNSTGDNVETLTCPPGAPYCIPDGGCSASPCVPGVTRTCLDAVTVGVCGNDGAGFVALETCTDGLCVEPGVCAALDACGDNEKRPSNLGCEYWAVDLPQDRGQSQGGNQRGGAEAEDWAVIVSNPGSVPAQITIAAATDLSTPVRSATVAPGSLEIITMPRADLYATSITRRSFRVVSTAPVAVHQFNPLDNVNVQSNDASLLFPVNALTGSYRILSYRTRVTWYASATVIAVRPGLTQVTVVSPTRIYSPENDEVNEDGVMAGWDDRNPRTFTLEQGQVLHLSTRFSTDLTGLSVEADQPVAVFSSAAGIYVPNARGTSDHIEHQMLPIEAWRTRYFGVPFRQRGTVVDYFRIGAGPQGARVTLSIPVNGQGWSNGVISLPPNGWTEFAASQPFELTSDLPVHVGHFMAGAQAEGVPTRCTSGSRQLGLGDPALTVLVPAEQWRDDYIVFTPNGYEEDLFTLFGPQNAVVQITDQHNDTTSVTLNTPIGSTGFGYAYFALPRNTAGTSTRSNIHTLQAEVPFGVEVYGWSCAVSYAYPGGLNLRNINDPE